LEVTPTLSYGYFGDFDEICDKLVEVYQDVASSTIAASEEGVVLYFVQKTNAKSPVESVISISKVKSVEY
jgi:hypothetical protein